MFGKKQPRAQQPAPGQTETAEEIMRKVRQEQIISNRALNYMALGLILIAAACITVTVYGAYSYLEGTGLLK